MTHVEKAMALYAKNTRQLEAGGGCADEAWKALGKGLLRTAANLDKLEELDAVKEVVAETKKGKSKSKRRDQDMSPQSYSAKNGPALFMEGPRKRSYKYVPQGDNPGVRGVTKPLKVWVQPKDYAETPGKTTLRLRKSVPPRITSG